VHNTTISYFDGWSPCTCDFVFGRDRSVRRYPPGSAYLRDVAKVRDARGTRFGPFPRFPLYLRVHPPTSPRLLVSMPPAPPQLLPTSQGPRLVVYHQTFHDSAGNYHSLLPLLTNHTGATHVIVAAIHLNDGPGNITLNDHRPDDKRYDQLWGEVKWLQGSGVKVLGMLGGAAQGSYERLGGSEDHVRASHHSHEALRQHRR
jgi:hypothetical protein